MPCLSVLDIIESRGLSRHRPCVGPASSRHAAREWLRAMGAATLDHYPSLPRPGHALHGVSLPAPFASLARRMSLLDMLDSEEDARLCPVPAETPSQRRRSSSLSPRRVKTDPEPEIHAGRGLGRRDRELEGQTFGGHVLRERVHHRATEAPGVCLRVY